MARACYELTLSLTRGSPLTAWIPSPRQVLAAYGREEEGSDMAYKDIAHNRHECNSRSAAPRQDEEGARTAIRS